MIRMALGTFVHDLGERLVQCDGDCDGVAHDLAAGILPRCMVLESQDVDDRGCVVVGLNPGRCPQSERAYYLEHGCTYDSVEGFWNETSSRIKYNTLVRRFLKACGLSGSVLWTELAKCESSLGSSSIPPVQTLRRCTGRYLTQELAAVPGDWPVIGVGADAFRALAFLEPDRVVLGLPHPTGSRGHFARLFDGDSLHDDVQGTITTLLSSNERQAHWLGRPGV